MCHASGPIRRIPDSTLACRSCVSSVSVRRVSQASCLQGCGVIGGWIVRPGGSSSGVGNRTSEAERHPLWTPSLHTGRVAQGFKGVFAASAAS